MSYVNNIKMFVRVYELGSMSAAARDQRTSPAVASARISELEKHLGVRLFSRTTRSLQPTENGRIFFDGAKKVLESIDEAEAAVMDVTQNPRGTIFVSAPLGVGRRFIAPHVPVFKDLYPQIDVRLRLSDRVIDVITEGLDVAFHLGILDDSTLKVRLIADCPRVLCASPAYVARVATAFNNDGAGVKGNMKAVIRAILLDDEARNASGLTAAGFGKLREPMLRLVQWVRTFGAGSKSGAWKIDDRSSPGGALAQSPLRSPSVFNFFRPGYVPPSTVATSRILAMTSTGFWQLWSRSLTWTRFERMTFWPVLASSVSVDSCKSRRSATRA